MLPSSLLLAAFVISNSITWTASKHHFTHNASRHRSRHRRQGAGLYLPASFVIPGGAGSGAWGDWGEVSPCSRTCGGGVASQKRICLAIAPDGRPMCTGGDTKFFSCQTQDCPTEVDFRAEQCSQYDDVPFKGIKHKWIPYTNGPRECELNCMPKGERFYYRHKPKVTDGTRCNTESFDVCVDGTCQPVGCDMMLGSNAREDKCRQCRGNGTNCYTVSKRIDTQDLRKGYNDILLIPQGATNIYIAEIKESNNYLALRSQHNEYYLNGEYHIDFPRTLMIAGAPWHYERSQQGFAAPDKLRCLGPTTEPLYLSLLLQDQNVGIDCEYSIPTALAPPPNQQYIWVHDDFTPCSTTCGGGFQTRNVTCRLREELDVVDESLCDAGLKPSTNETCNLKDCAAAWVPGPWSPCSKPCGEGGSRSRQVQCQKIVTNGVTFSYPSIVADEQCFELLGPKPPLFEECNKAAKCPTWFTGPWKPCDKLCGEGKQTRQVVCHQKTGGRVEVLADSECADDRPPAEQPCMIHPCEGVDWVLSDWTGCDNCLSLVKSREKQCATKEKTVVDPKFCANHVAPETEKACDPSELPPCQVQWYATQWSNCSVECGKGVKTRRVFCGQFNGVSVVVVDDRKCENETKYNDTTPCEIPQEKCPAKWFAGPWSECTKRCGGGEQYRKVMCLSGGQPATSCAEATLLDSTQSCNIGPCDADETLPVNATATTVMEDEDYEDCEEDEDGEEVGAELGGYDAEDLTGFYSDAPSPDDSSTSPGFSEIETEFTDGMEGSGAETTWSTEGTESTETIFTEETIVTGTDLTSETFETVTGETGLTEVTESGATEETGSTNATPTDSSGGETESEASTVSSGSSASDITEETESEKTSTSVSLGTESTETIVTEETIVTGTDLTSETFETVTGETGSTQVTESGATEGTGSTDATPTDSSGAETESEASTVSSGSSASDITEETEIESPGSTTEAATGSTVTEITGSTEPEATGSTETDSSASTTEAGTEITAGGSATASGPTTETSDLSTTESSDLSTAEGVTESVTSTGSTEIAGSTETELSGSTEPTESGTGVTESETSTGSTEIVGSTETESPGSTESTVSGTTGITGASSDSEATASTVTEGATEAAETGSTETEITGSTESGGTTEVTSESGSTETSTSEGTEITGSSTESGSTTEFTESKETFETDTTPYDWSTTILQAKRPHCRPRKRPAKCIKSTFGCCPDKKTLAAGPFDEGCPNPTTCKETRFGCCSDGVSPAEGAHNKGCPSAKCNETLYGCCKSDNSTPAEGNDQEGCPRPPPACKSSKFGCCKDEKTEATGPHRKGCPETATVAPKPAEGKGCAASKFGCCYDNKTEATGPEGQGCPCTATRFGCCPDNVTPAGGTAMEGCVRSCNTSQNGCCPDGETPAHGPDGEGCCLLTPFGCCPDNYQPAREPHREGCECQYARFGCCPDNRTIARGADKEGCGCEHTEHGCCPDRHTEATGPKYEGCGCHTYQFGCCPDGVTFAKGPGLQGCDCRQSTYGCCSDEQTAATGPDGAGCDCASSKYGCCPDGQTEAKGQHFAGCTDVPENRQAACALEYNQGTCHNYTKYWYFDMQYGGCSRFWYGGCEGNGNRFANKEECEDVCVRPSARDVCKLPKVLGSCPDSYPRWYYNPQHEQCGQFVYSGCLGNANNFESRDLCQAHCEPDKNKDQCQQSIERGSCAGSFSRWGFNAADGRCEQFTWGGCEGNANRFSSEAACVLRCQPPGELQPECTQPQDAGNCTEKLPSWSFSAAENRCLPFYYTGCGGNGNRFSDEYSCARACPSAFDKEVCTLPAVTGDCANYRLRWYYDTTNQRCGQFYYGGCGGNGNNFGSEEECQGSCAAMVTTTTTTQRPPEPEISRTDECQLPMKTGRCEESIPRWFYDAATDHCSQFAYSGCEGNNNNFGSAEECEQRCRSGAAPAQRPSAPAAPAPAPAPAPSTLPECQVEGLETCTNVGRIWFLDSATGACEARETPAGDGCQARGVFPSPEACERTCGAFRDLDVCALPAEPGPCTEYQVKYYFDRAWGSCRQFMYGGCRGGANRFSTIDECESVCMHDTDPCKQLPEAGNCLEYHEVWYYDEARNDCNQFVWTGCEGNGNRFASREECEGQCKRAPAQPAPTAAPAPATRPTPPLDDECQPPESLSPCGADQLSFYYDAARGACAPAQIGNCRYVNNWRTEEECERRCGAYKGQDPCRARLDPGPCRAAVAKLYWDMVEGRCLQFTYGGCQGGPNRFSTLDECEEVCGYLNTDPACRLPAAPGAACGAGERRWFHSELHGECREFIYLGCGGNANNFLTLQQCRQHCSVPFTDDEIENGIIPVNCSAATAECAALRCPYSVKRTYGADGCERCECVEPDCSAAAAVCAALRCSYGIQRTRLDDGCERCECIEPDCSAAVAACAALRCPYGVQRTQTANGCEGCECVESNCSAAVASCEALRCSYGIQRTRLDDGCERCECIEPDCSATTAACEALRCPYGVQRTRTANGCEGCECIEYDCSVAAAACAALRCPYGVQRTRAADGCERCECIEREVDCSPFVDECAKINCRYDVMRTKEADGCTRCTCTKHPCEVKQCPEGQKCVPTAMRDPITDDIRYSTDCRTVNKPGWCDVEEPLTGSCRRECNDDADCRGAAKCCAAGCSHVCRDPAAPTSPKPSQDHYLPDAPQAPQASADTEREVTSSEGGKATLRCLFHSNPPPKITWKRGEITIDGSVGRYRLTSDGALEIVSLYRNDAGVYICVAENELGSAQQEVELKVTGPREVAAGIAGEPTAEALGEVGRPLSIRCLAYGHPAPSIAWYRGPTGPMVPYDSKLYEARGNVLLIRALDFESLGEYTCQAYNGISKPASWTVVVRAYRRDDRWPASAYLLAPDAAETPRPSAPDRAATTHQPIVEYPYVPVYTVPVHTAVRAGQTTLAAGAELSLPCEVDGHPEPDVYWTKDGARLQQSDKMHITSARLTVSGVSVNDSGVYGCHADNQYSSHYSTVRINVQELYVPAQCQDNQYFANCQLIVRSKFCSHKYYSRFCCKSCVEAGQLNPQELQFQADQSWMKK